MRDSTRELSQEYWRPAPTAVSQFQTLGYATQPKVEFCTICGTQYAPGARYCQLCGLNHEDARHSTSRGPILDWLDFGRIREQTGLSTVSLVCVLASAIFMLAAVMTGLVYSTSSIAEWQAVQTWRIEWLLATVAALLAALLFKRKP